MRLVWATKVQHNIVIKCLIKKNMKLDLLLWLTARPVGDSEPESGAFAFYGVRPDLSVQFGYDGLGDGKSQPRSLLSLFNFTKRPNTSGSLSAGIPAPVSFT